MNMENRRLKLAIVDDRGLFMETLANALAGYPDLEISFTAVNGLAMQQEIERHGPPDVVLLDVEMPVMNGYATAGWLAQRYPQARILALSLYEDEAVVRLMLLRGAHGFLLKGTDTRTIHEAVQAVHRHGVLTNAYVTPRLLREVDRPPPLDKLPGPEDLRDRHFRLLEHIQTDDTYEGIADKLCLSEATVKGYADELYKALGVHSRAAAVQQARRLGLLPLD